MVNRRASLNRLIETSCIPELWITNNAEVLDPAVLRRFDVVIQLEAMPRSAKLSLMKESLLSMPDTAAVQSDSAVSAPAMERSAEIDAEPGIDRTIGAGPSKGDVARRCFL